MKQHRTSVSEIHIWQIPEMLFGVFAAKVSLHNVKENTSNNARSSTLQEVLMENFLLIYFSSVLSGFCVVWSVMIIF